MKYSITYATSSDRHSAKHLYVIVSTNRLPGKIAQLQGLGNIIVSVSQQFA